MRAQQINLVGPLTPRKRIVEFTQHLPESRTAINREEYRRISDNPREGLFNWFSERIFLL